MDSFGKINLMESTYRTPQRWLVKLFISQYAKITNYLYLSEYVKTIASLFKFKKFNDKKIELLFKVLYLELTSTMCQKEQHKFNPGLYPVIFISTSLIKLYQFVIFFF